MLKIEENVAEILNEDIRKTLARCNIEFKADIFYSKGPFCISIRPKSKKELQKLPWIKEKI